MIAIWLVCRFQSTLPMRGATRFPKVHRIGLTISIHAPHAGSDALVSHSSASAGHFNPRSPCGERPISIRPGRLEIRISIHAPHAGSDSPASTDRNGRIYFNPRSPCGERHSITVIIQISFLISIHDPHTGSDRTNSVIHSPRQQSFQSTLPMRGATHL